MSLNRNWNILTVMSPKDTDGKSWLKHNTLENSRQSVHTHFFRSGETLNIGDVHIMHLRRMTYVLEWRTVYGIKRCLCSNLRGYIKHFLTGIHVSCFLNDLMRPPIHDEQTKDPQTSIGVSCSIFVLSMALQSIASCNVGTGNGYPVICTVISNTLYMFYLTLNIHRNCVLNKHTTLTNYVTMTTISFDWSLSYWIYLKTGNNKQIAYVCETRDTSG